VSLGGGKESAVRLALTALGVALGVSLLLFTTVAFPALHAHDARAGWTTTSAHNRRPAQDESTTDPLLWRVSNDRFEGHDIVRVDVAPEGPRAPVPDWLAHLPGPGEIAASPHLAQLLRTTDPALLGDRFPGRVTETIGKQALQSSDELVIVIGHTPAELGSARGVQTVRSIEGAPLAHKFSDFLRIVLVVGALGLLVPVLVFVSTATRLAAARREQRLAAMRLAGATPRQADTLAGVEAALAAAVGTALGFLVYFVVRPYAARVPFDGQPFYVSDLHLAVGWALLIAIGVPVLAVAAALISLRRVRVSPLGVTRQTRRQRPTARRLGVLVGALLFFIVSLAEFSHGNSNTAVFAIGFTFALIVLGIVVCGPWLTTLVARGMGRAGRRAPSLLAARRLEDNPSAGFRAISGLILAVFVASLVSALAASATASAPFTRSAISSTDVGVVASVTETVQNEQDIPRLDATVGLDVASAARLVAGLRAVSGVDRVVELRALPADVGADVPPSYSYDGDTRVVTVFPAGAVVRCTDAAALSLPPCTGTTVIDPNIQFNNGRLSNLPRPFAVPASALASQRLVGVAVLTNGNTATIERVRTRLDLAYPGSSAETGSDLSAEQNWQVHNIAQLSSVALGLTLLIAGCSLAVSVAGGLVERKRPFALLRLAGMPLRQLHRVVLAEAAAPLLVVAAASAALGFAVDAILIVSIGNSIGFRLPTLGYWVALAGGLALALVIVSATLPLLDRVTSLETARFE
jgi:hypothetical protein